MRCTGKWRGCCRCVAAAAPSTQSLWCDMLSVHEALACCVTRIRRTSAIFSLVLGRVLLG
jgi:hypothetical protein